MAPTKTKQDVQDDEKRATSEPPRDQHQTILKQIEEDGHKVQPETFYVIRNQWGEQEYITKDRDDAVARLRELSGVQIGPAGTPAGHPHPSPTGDPGRTLQEVQAIDPHAVPPLAESYARAVAAEAERSGENVENAKVG